MNIQQGQNTSSWDNQNKCLWRLDMAFPRSTRCNVSCIVFQHLTLQRFQISHKWPSYSIICLNIQFIISLGFPSMWYVQGLRCKVLLCMDCLTTTYWVPFPLESCHNAYFMQFIFFFKCISQLRWSDITSELHELKINDMIKLRDLGLLSLKKRRLQVDLIVTFQ